MTDVTLSIGDGSGSDISNFTVTIRATRVDESYTKALITFPIPKMTIGDNWERKCVDLRDITRTVVISGWIDATSSNLSGSNTASEAKTDLSWLLERGYKITLDWGISSYSNMQMSKLQYSEEAMDETTPTKYTVSIELLEADDI